MAFEKLALQDKAVLDGILAEKKRQNANIELIASENFVSEAVMEAQGSHLTNKYAEGYPGKRYYGGCEHVDVVENIARDRVKELFGAEYANVQPHSGAQANMAVYHTILKPGDTVLGMNLSHGGHLTHGSPVNFPGELYNFVEYGVTEDTNVNVRVIHLDDEYLEWLEKNELKNGNDARIQYVRMLSNEKMESLIPEISGFNDAKGKVIGENG